MKAETGFLSGQVEGKDLKIFMLDLDTWHRLWMLLFVLGETACVTAALCPK